MKAVILAAGRGKRLRPLTDSVPKPMIEIGGKPILLWQIEWLRSYGITEFVLCISHLREKIQDHFQDGKGFGVCIDYAIEEQPMGTGGGLKNAAIYLRDQREIFVLNGDVLTNLNLGQIQRMLQDTEVIAAIALVPLPSPFGIVELDEEDFVRSFKEKPRLPDYWINAGVYCFSHHIVDYLPDNGSLEHDVFPLLAEERKLKASKQGSCFWRSIDNPKDIEEVSTLISQIKP